MSSIDKIGEAIDALRVSHEAGRLAHAYLVTGSPRGEGLAFAEGMIRLVLEDISVDVHQHPDVAWLEPEKKSRVIGIEQVRDANKRVSQKSYAGGWKVIVLLAADRLHENASNALLKTLEEPSPRTILILVTDAPQALKPTIASRCQRITLAAAQGVPQGAWLEPLLSVLRKNVRSPLESLIRASQIKALLDIEREKLVDAEELEDADDDDDDEDLEKDVMDARIEAKVKQVRSDVLLVLELWSRDLLLVAQGGEPTLLYFRDDLPAFRQAVAGRSVEDLLRDVRAIRAIVRRLDRNVPDLLAFESSTIATFRT